MYICTCVYLYMRIDLAAQFCPKLRIASQMQQIIDRMNGYFQELAEKEADVLLDTEGKCRGCTRTDWEQWGFALRSRNVETNKAAVMALYVKCTKDDVTLNNFITRSKYLGHSRNP